MFQNCYSTISPVFRLLVGCVVLIFHAEQQVALDGNVHVGYLVGSTM